MAASRHVKFTPYDSGIKSVEPHFGQVHTSHLTMQSANSIEVLHSSLLQKIIVPSGTESGRKIISPTH